MAFQTTIPWFSCCNSHYRMNRTCTPSIGSWSCSSGRHNRKRTISRRRHDAFAEMESFSRQRLLDQVVIYYAEIEIGSSSWPTSFAHIAS
ncbi:unnamed protein product [Nesidiocoris tenuis]|uniref:Uncharacterized protein n=1 Tax=Nesidiocoris tenuis TaxID=355587 RepID=A0A6H5HBK5_9HEMI|nr:unnamed protein product [Nesidiocoris tenuis]